MNSWNRPRDYRLTVSRAKRFSHRKPVKSRHPITNACRKMTGGRGKFVARRKRSTTRKIIFQKSHDHLLFLISFRPTRQVSPISILPRKASTLCGLSSLFFAIGTNSKYGIRYIIAREQTRTYIIRIEVYASSFQSTCWSILIRKLKTEASFWLDNMASASESASVCSIDIWTLFVKSLGTLGRHRETSTLKFALVLILSLKDLQSRKFEMWKDLMFET